MINVRLALIAPLLTAAPISAEAACWPAEQADAATIRDFQSMLMVTALRCARNADISADYNAFVVAEREPLEWANLRLKLHFREEAGPVAGQIAYDRFTTALANAYGAGSSTPEDCARGAALARRAAAAARAALLEIAQTALFGRPVTACEAPEPGGGGARVTAVAAPVTLALGDTTGGAPAALLAVGAAPRAGDSAVPPPAATTAATTAAPAAAATQPIGPP